VRYKSFRPQLIICDDVETLESVKSDEGKDKTVTWFDRDIIPLGDENTVVVVLGTIMSPGALLSTLIQRMQEGKMSGVFHRFPLIDEENCILWRDRWPDSNSIETFRKDMGIVEKSWQTEYLLNAWIEENQVISSKMIHYYEGSVPRLEERFRGTIIAVDLAVSQKQTADYTAIVCGEFYGYGDEAKLYILPSPLNRRMEYPTTKKLLTEIYDDLSKKGKAPILVIEDVGTQKGFIQDLRNEGYPVKEFSPGNQDKYSRLWRISEAINSERVLFPKNGCEQLINQLLNFGLIVQHDDLIDACVMCVSHMLETRKRLVRTFSSKPHPF
jgi:predicted phage terminase large subunit-like protein